jgi:hypothetical protein
MNTRPRLLIVIIAIVCLLPLIGCSKTPQNMSAFLDKYEATVVQMEKTDWSSVSISTFAKMSASQIEMVNELERLQGKNIEMTPAEMNRYVRLTERLASAMGKAQAAMNR